MGIIEYTEGTGVPHKGFADEFLTHRKCSEWWYSTGYLEDDEEKLYSFQFTLAKITIYGITFHMLLTSVTDVAANRHYYGQRQAFFGRGINTTSQETAFGEFARITYSPNELSALGCMQLDMRGKDYMLKLDMQAQKPPVWHCEDGKLRMGLPNEPRQVTYYFSFTNLAAEGFLTLGSKTLKVHGKAWFDRQGGTYQLTNPLTNWEWFSFRFFDGEELMLFSFPQTGYADGTYIQRNDVYQRLNEYQIEPKVFIIEPTTKYRFSSGWKVMLRGIKDEVYEVKPVTEGQFNVFFFELLAEAINPQGVRVGYCFVELLPGARNKKLNALLAFKHAK